jgi:hypothetical protein
MSDLKTAHLVVPLHYGVTLYQRFGNLGISPFPTQYLFDVVSQKIGEGLPFPVVQLVSHGDELVPLVFDRDNRSAQSLLLLALEFLRSVLLEETSALFNDLSFRPIVGQQSRECVLRSSVAVLELMAAATQAWVVAADLWTATERSISHAQGALVAPIVSS